MASLHDRDISGTPSRPLTRGTFVNDFTDTIAAYGSSGTGTAKSAPSHFYPKIYLPSKIYEALPAAYVSVGMLFVLGAVYLGLGHGIGYLAAGLTSIFGGLRIHGIRQRARAPFRRTTDVTGE